MSDQDQGNKPTKSEHRLRLFVAWTVAVIVISFSVIAIFLIIRAGFHTDVWVKPALDHYAAGIGLPMAAAASLFIVTVLRATEGPLEFKGLGFEFKGASGPVVLWLLCFLGIAGAIKLVWNVE